jgi:hypothetical protein
MRDLLGRIVAVALAAAAGGCSGDVNPVRDVAVAVGAGAQPRTAPDFVAGSRPEKLEYLPVGTSAAPPQSKAKPQASVQSLEAEMDAVRAKNEARGAEARAAATPAPAAAR